MGRPRPLRAVDRLRWILQVLLQVGTGSPVGGRHHDIQHDLPIQAFQPGQPRNGRVSIGIYNVNSRLKLNYGDKYGVRIFSEVGVGTTAEIEFPAVMQKPGADSALRLRMKKAEQEDADS